MSKYIDNEEVINVVDNFENNGFNHLESILWAICHSSEVEDSDTAANLAVIGRNILTIVSISREYKDNQVVKLKADYETAKNQYLEKESAYNEYLKQLKEIESSRLSTMEKTLEAKNELIEQLSKELKCWRAKSKDTEEPQQIESTGEQPKQ